MKALHETVGNWPQKPSVTVVVPNYNHGRFLTTSLGSIAGQTRPPERVLIIDDASTDNSREIIAEFQAHFPTWELIEHQVRKGVVFGQNEAVSLESSDWITFLGADDVLHPDYLAEALNEVTANPGIGLVCACCEIIGQVEERSIRPAILPRTSAGPISATEFRSLLKSADNYFPGTVTLYSRKALLALGGFNDELGSFSDAFLSRQISTRFGLAFIPRILGYWRIHGQNYSVVTSTNPKATNATLELIRNIIIDENCAFFPEDYDDIFARRTKFGSARLIAIATDVDASVRARRIADMLNSSFFERACMTILLSLGRFGAMASTFWLIMRLRPMSFLKWLSQAGLRRRILRQTPVNVRE